MTVKWDRHPCLSSRLVRLYIHFFARLVSSGWPRDRRVGNPPQVGNLPHKGLLCQ
jgi:hypothetical protein